jgi:hypothetical protein
VLLTMPPPPNPKLLAAGAYDLKDREIAAPSSAPGQIQGTKTFGCTANPAPKHVSTSYVERNNLTMRMSMRRFTRLTNGFSKKAAKHAHSVAIHFMHYNFVRIHQTLRVTPAMAAGVSKTLWSLTDMMKVSRNGSIAKRLTCEF